MLKKSLKALFLDLDGTIANTEPLAERAIKQVFLAEKIQISDELSSLVVGRSWRKSIQMIGIRLPHVSSLSSVPFESWVDTMVNRCSAVYLEFLKSEKISEIRGASSFIRASRRAGLGIAVVSGSKRIEILEVLNNLNLTDEMDFILSIDDYKESKPSPIGYQNALEQMSKKQGEAINFKNALVFEDSIPGLESAIAANLPVVWVSPLKTDALPYEIAATMTGAESALSTKNKGQLWCKIPDFSESSLKSAISASVPCSLEELIGLN